MEATDNRKISICIATRNEFDKVIQSFAKVIADERISEIVILDDASENEIFWWKLEDWLEFDAPEGKIKLGRNDLSLGTSLNKQRAVIFANNEWVFLMDANGVMEESYLDRLYMVAWEDEIIIQFSGVGSFFNRKYWLWKFDEEQKHLDEKDGLHLIKKKD